MFASDAMKEAHRQNFSGEKNPGWKGGVSVHSVSASGIRYRRPQRHIEAEKVVRRKRVQSKATPGWANIEKIRAIYREAQRLTKLTGDQYHVDHIVPLTSNLVCGLHCEANLQILLATPNLKKHNREWPDMP